MNPHQKNREKLSGWGTSLLQHEEAYTIPVALNSLAGAGKIDYDAIMVDNTISILPIAIVFMFCSKMIISGLTKGALKS